jgi:hypothetical protein
MTISAYREERARATRDDLCIATDLPAVRELKQNT